MQSVPTRKTSMLQAFQSVCSSSSTPWLLRSALRGCRGTVAGISSLTHAVVGPCCVSHVLTLWETPKQKHPTSTKSVHPDPRKTEPPRAPLSVLQVWYTEYTGPLPSGWCLASGTPTGDFPAVRASGAKVPLRVAESCGESRVAAAPSRWDGGTCFRVRLNGFFC